MKQNTDTTAGVKGSISSLRTVQALASDGTASTSTNTGNSLVIQSRHSLALAYDGTAGVPSASSSRPSASSVPLASTNTTSVGYWIALHFSDQGTGAFCNLRSFLCLSSSVGRVRVVEPFLVGSDVGLDVSANWTREVPYTDVFHSGALRGYGSLVPFHTFLREAPRKLVVAQYKCIGLSLCRPCGHEDVLARGRKFSELNGFEMVGHVCLEYKTEGMMTVKEFTSQLYSTYNKSDVVVMFPLFGGLVNNRGKGYRLFMAPAKCQINNATICNISTIKPSQLVETSADNYIHKYLKGGSFIREAPRKLVVAQYKCIGLSLCRPCGHEDVLARGRKFSELNGFEMVGHVCLEYKTEGMMTVKEFTSQLYSTYNKSDVVVMFPLFGGLVNNRGKGYRLFMAPAKCQINNATICNISTIKPSQLVETSADNYIHKYLKGGSFITVMVRFETLLRPKNEIDLKMCLSHLYEKLVELKTQFGIESIVLCLDIGKYGSQYFRDNQKSMGPILPHVNRFISQSVKEGMTLSNWEDTFTNTSLRQNPGFVGLVQKTIATRGDVLVLLGKPSTFHSSTEKIFLRSHPEERVFNLENSC